MAEETQRQSGETLSFHHPDQEKRMLNEKQEPVTANSIVILMLKEFCGIKMFDSDN